MLVFLSHGFRPFFLFAGLYAVVPMIVWLFWYAAPGIGILLNTLAGSLPPSVWHGHEMIYGYTMAVVGGFFLTAVPNWTGREPVRGRLLGALAATWLVGRAALWLTNVLPVSVTAALDLSFVPFLAILIIKALSGGWSKRNAVFMPILAALFAGNVLVHLDAAGILPGWAGRGLVLGLDAVVLLITVIGGRVVPAFTTNALRRHGESALPVSRPWVERVSILLTAAVLVADLARPGGFITGSIAIAAALANALRLAGWRGHKTFDQPILWIIHLGYAWLVIGLAAKGMAILSGWFSETTTQHVLTIGAIGSMTMGVMSRAALGHTGRPLVVAPAITAAYVLVSLAALARVAGPVLLPSLETQTVALAGVLWCVAYAIFTVVYWPMLTRPRVGREG
jgi:uncharacterized protein involved in response to NO